MRLAVLRSFSGLSAILLGAVGVALPLGLVETPLERYAPIFFYFSLILLLLALTLSQLGIFFAGLARDWAGCTPDAPRYVSRIADRFVWPSATLLLVGCFLFAVSFVV